MSTAPAVQIEPLSAGHRAALAAGQPAAVARAVAPYAAVGWTGYTRDPARLAGAIAHTTHVAIAHADGVWLGLARALSDGHSVCFVQDLLVHPTARRQGLARALMAQVCPPGLRAVLLTDGDPTQRGVYAALGFQPADALPLTAYVRIP